MASIESVVSGENSLSQFERVRGEIRSKFYRAHQSLQMRESVLLAELQELEDQSQVSEEMKQLALSKEQLQTILKGNTNKEILEQSIAPIDKKIKHLQSLLDSPRKVEFDWDEEIECKLNSLGSLRINTEMKVSKFVPNYKQKGEPVGVFGKHKTEGMDPGVFAYPNGIYFDIERKKYFICDTGNHRVQVVDNTFHFLFMFSEKMEGPSDISILQDKLYVTQFKGNCLNVYSQDYKFLESVGEEGVGQLRFKDPRGLALSPEWNRIYICEFGNKRVQCLNLDFSFNSFINNITGAQDVKLTPQEIVILSNENPCIQIYNSSHQLSRQMITKGEDNQVKTTSRFFLDQDFNLLISDFRRHYVLIFSYTGVLIHKFGKEGEGKGDFIKPNGITMDSQGRIVVVSENPNHCIQMF